MASAPQPEVDKGAVLAKHGLELVLRFKRYGDIRAIQESIEKLQQANDLTPIAHPEKPTRLEYLGMSVRRRFLHLGKPEDLSFVINAAQLALELTPQGHAHMHHRLGNLATCISDRYKRHGELEDLEQSIRFDQQAVELTPDGHPDKPARLANLAFSLSDRYRRHGELEDLESSIRLDQQAVELTPDGHPDKPARIANLAVSLSDRHRRHGELEDLESSITLYQQAVELTPDGHRGRVTQLYNLGLSLRDQFVRQPNKPNFDSAVIRFLESAMQPLGDPLDRLKSARECVSFLSAYPDFGSVENRLSAHACIIEILPEVVWLGHAVDRRYEESSRIGTVVNGSVAAAIRLNSLAQAVEWLEAGRSLVWSQILSLRAPLDNLVERHPDLAASLDEISRKLQRSVHASRTSVRRVGDASNSSLISLIADKRGDAHRLLVMDYNRILASVRECRGFEDFLRPSKFDSFLPLLKHIDGPVVFINVHSSSCDALALFPDGSTKHIVLTALTEVIARGLQLRWMTSLSYAHSRTRASGSPEDQTDSFDFVFARLWEWIVCPILQALNLMNKTAESADGQLPHVTWCPTGPLTRLPLHAAGMYNSAQENRLHAFDYVVSSYTPSLSALLRSQEGANDLTSKPKVLVVTQPATLGHGLLPGTRAERARLATVLPKSALTVLDHKDATVDRTLKAMCAHPWVHLACHGSQQKADPTASFFALYDGPMTLSALMGTTANNAELAFLSACQTAVGDEKVPEESVHLAAGMLAVGFKGVVATMWSICDNVAPVIVEAYYKKLLELRRSGEVAPGYTGAAYALHDAVKVLRGHVGAENFVKWAPFVHFGV